MCDVFWMTSHSLAREVLVREAISGTDVPVIYFLRHLETLINNCREIISLELFIQISNIIRNTGSYN